MAKVEEIVTAPISFKCRDNVREVVLPLVNEILGVEFKSEYENQNPKVAGITIYVCDRLRPHSWHLDESDWVGAIIKLSFRNSRLQLVTRSLNIPTTGKIDCIKLKAKWVEMLGLKADDDDLKENRAQREAANDAKTNALWAAVEGINMDGVFSARAKPGGFDVRLRGVTPEQLKAIAAIMQSGGQ